MHFLARASVLLRKPVVRLVQKPTPLTLIGAGKRREIPALLKTAGKTKTLFLVSRTLHRSGMLEELFEEVRAAGGETVVYDGVTPDPTFREVGEAAKLTAGCDSVVAIGGGSVLDTAKLVAAAGADPGRPLERFAGILRVKKQPLFLIMAPTTAGTGSETTLASVISESDTHRKKQLLDPKLVPFAAVLDPELTVSLPQHITVQTTMDALTHALEAYTSTYRTAETDRMAEMAVVLIYENLPLVREEPQDLHAREQLLLASFLAGMAFTRVYVGYVHAFAHAIGGMFGVSHGLANAVLLPYVMEYYRPVCGERFARLGTVLHLPGEGRDEKADAFLESLQKLGQESGIPRCLEAFPQEAVSEVCRAGFRECHGTYPVPRYLNKKEAEALLRGVARKA